MYDLIYILRIETGESLMHDTDVIVVFAMNVS